MIKRQAYQSVLQALSRQAAVALIGPRQVGKTTLALEIGKVFPSIYLDLESRADRDKLSDPELYLSQYENHLVILDEIHRMPELFQTLRGMIDQARRSNKPAGKYLILGSASMDLLRQSSESLAGRIEYIEMNPFNLVEVAVYQGTNYYNPLWLRGGFPGSYLANNDQDSFVFRMNFIRTYLERDIPQFGFRIPAETLERFWTMLAHNQGGLLNASKLAAGLAVSVPTIGKYIDLLVDLLLVRRLQPYHANVAKRQIKSPKIYIRDSGLVHALLGLPTYNDLVSHPVVGSSFEGYVIENIVSILPDKTPIYFYRSNNGAEIDLILGLPHRVGMWAIEIKRGLAARPTKGFYHAIEDVQPASTFVVYAGKENYKLAENIEAISLEDLCAKLQAIASFPI